MASLGVRQNYHEDCEKVVNTQIELELYAMYRFLAMSSYFSRHDVALPNFAKYFRKSAHEELEHAQKLMEFQNMRGGKVEFQDIKKPTKQAWDNGECVCVCVCVCVRMHICLRMSLCVFRVLFLSSVCTFVFPLGLDAMEDALELERKVNKSFLNLHKIADEHCDPQVNIMC